MRITYDAEADAGYLFLADPIAPGRSVRTVEVESRAGSVILDFDADGILLGVEVLGAAATLPAETLARAERIDR